MRTTLTYTVLVVLLLCVHSASGEGGCPRGRIRLVGRVSRVVRQFLVRLVERLQPLLPLLLSRWGSG